MPELRRHFMAHFEPALAPAIMAHQFLAQVEAAGPLPTGSIQK